MRETITVKANNEFPLAYKRQQLTIPVENITCIDICYDASWRSPMLIFGIKGGGAFYIQNCPDDFCINERSRVMKILGWEE